MTFIGGDVYDHQTEAHFQAEVVKLLHMLGWPKELVYHTYDSRRSREGFPDIVALRPRDGRLFVAELKAQRGRTSDAQRRWIDGLADVRHITSGLFRPSDLERLVKVLR